MKNITRWVLRDGQQIRLCNWCDKPAAVQRYGTGEKALKRAPIKAYYCNLHASGYRLQLKDRIPKPRFNRRTIAPDQVQEILNLHQRGWTIPQISVRVRRAFSTVQYVLTREGRDTATPELVSQQQLSFVAEEWLKGRSFNALARELSLPGKTLMSYFKRKYDYKEVRTRSLEPRTD